MNSEEAQFEVNGSILDVLPSGITLYEENGRRYFQVYVNERSKIIPTIRAQKRIRKIESLGEALKVKEHCVKELAKRVTEREAEGLTWGDIVHRWEHYWRRYPSRTFNDDTLRDHLARLRNWTDSWWNKPACKISIGDAREIIKEAYGKGAALTLRKAIKQSINQVFKWGMEERLIPGIMRSPARDIEILCAGESRPEEKRKEVLTSEQISEFLETAARKEHPWYAVWFVGFHSGMRTGELEALRKERIELVPVDVGRQLDALPAGDPRRNYGFIRVEWAWKAKGKQYGPTKAHYWRTVPINSELYWFLVKYLAEADFGRDELGARVFPILPSWRVGAQAHVIRLFCEANGLESIKFHTIRACFATQLLGLGVPEDKVMKVGGWKDVDTMRIYVRAAGIHEHGSTEGLKFLGGGRKFDPSTPYRNVDYRKASQWSEEDIDEDDEDALEGGVRASEAQSASQAKAETQASEERSESQAWEASRQKAAPVGAHAQGAVGHESGAQLLSLAQFRKERAR